MSKLAIKGGKPVRTKGWPDWPVYDETEIESIMQVIKSRCWCALPYIFKGKGKNIEEESKVKKLEKEFAEYHDAKHGIAVNGGSSALLVSYAAAGVRSGDEVIMPPRTYITTATAALCLNAIPIFVDVEEDTLLIDPDKIEEAITDRTKAIVPVHYAGYPCDMDRIMEIAKKHNLMVIADACHAHGSEWKGKKVASISHLSAFSFQQGKNMTCGDGGMIITNDDELAAKCCQIAISDGRSASESAGIVFNLRMTEFEGAIALAQFRRLDAQIEKKEANVAYLSKRLEKIGGIRFPKRDERITRMPHLYPMVKYEQEAFDGVPATTFAQAMQAEGIPIGAVTEARALYKYPLFAEKLFDKGILSLYGKEIDYNDVHCPVCEGYAGKWLNFNQTLLLGTEEDMEDFARAVEKIKENLKELK